MNKSMTSLYIDYTLGKAVNEEIITTTWGQIPQSIHSIPSMILNHSRAKATLAENFFTFMRIIIKHMKQIGIITHPIIEKINEIQDRQESLGIFEFGHQPLLFGGGFFISGKVALLDSITQHVETSTSKNVLPIFFIGGHDRLHNELITARFPQYKSSKGLFLKFPTTDQEEEAEIPIFRLRKPPSKWINESLDKIEGNFMELIKHSVQPQNRPLLRERVQSIITLFRTTWMQADTYADWIEKIWRDLYLFQCNVNVALLPVTDPDFNRFLLPSYEWLLSENTRTTFINSFNDITRFLEKEGFKPVLPYREDNFVPFYLQCPHCEFHPRLQPKIDVPGTLEAFCEQCQKEGKESTLVIEYNPNNPDLTEYQDWLLPRAESRTLSLCHLLPETLHLGGSGETAYHAQLFPIYRKLHVTPPIFVKTHRLHFTTPWTEKTAQQLEQVLNATFLPNKQLFTITRKIRKSKDINKARQLQLELEKLLETNFQAILEHETILQDRLSQESPDMGEVKDQLNLLQVYASHFYGRFAPEHTKPDVSWNWSTMGMLTGMHDIVQFIQRNTNPLIPIGTTVFLSPGMF